MSEETTSEETVSKEAVSKEGVSAEEVSEEEVSEEVVVQGRALKKKKNHKRVLVLIDTVRCTGCEL